MTRRPASRNDVAKLSMHWRLIALAMLGVLAACGYWPDDQLPGEAATSKAATSDHPITPEHVASLPAGQSRPVVNQLSNEVVAAETAP